MGEKMLNTTTPLEARSLGEPSPRGSELMVIGR